MVVPAFWAEEEEEGFKFQVSILFVIYPSFEKVGKIVDLIRKNGGEVAEFKDEYHTQPATPNAITLINFDGVRSLLKEIKKNKNKENNPIVKVPNDGFNIRFIEEYVKDRENTNLYKYLITPSSYKKCKEVKDVFLHKKTWDDLIKKTNPPEEFNIKDVRKNQEAWERFRYDDDDDNSSAEEAEIEEEEEEEGGSGGRGSDGDRDQMEFDSEDEENGNGDNLEDTEILNSEITLGDDDEEDDTFSAARGTTPKKPTPKRKKSKSLSPSGDEEDDTLTSAKSSSSKSKKPTPQKKKSKEPRPSGDEEDDTPSNGARASSKPKEPEPTPQKKKSKATPPGNDESNLECVHPDSSSEEESRGPLPPSTRPAPGPVAHNSKAPAPRRRPMQRSPIAMVTQVWDPPASSPGVRTKKKRHTPTPAANNNNPPTSSTSTVASTAPSAARGATPKKPTSKRKKSKSPSPSGDEEDDTPSSGPRASSKSKEPEPTPKKTKSKATPPGNDDESSLESVHMDSSEEEEGGGPPPVPVAHHSRGPAPVPQRQRQGPPVSLTYRVEDLDAPASPPRGRKKNRPTPTPAATSNTNNPPTSSTRIVLSTAPAPPSRPQEPQYRYSQAAGQKVLDLLMKNKWGAYGKGNSLWRYVEKHKLVEKHCGQRPWQSLRNYFKTKLAPFLDKPQPDGSFIVDPEDLAHYKRAILIMKRNPNNNQKQFPEPPLSSVKRV